MSLLNGLRRALESLTEAALKPAEDPRPARERFALDVRETDLSLVEGPGSQPTELALAAEVHRLRDALEAGFSAVGCEPGLKALQQLTYQYAQLGPALERKRSVAPLAIAQMPYVAEEAYRQGLSVLKDVLDLVEALRSPDRARLEAEAAALEAEIGALRASEAAAARVRLRQERLRSHRERLAIIKAQELRVEELLGQCERCEASLDRARMELSGLSGESSTAAVTAVTEALRRAVEQARSVQDDMKRLAL
jgi:hypothetical protein